MDKVYPDILTHLAEADGIVVGASNGLSISEGVHIFADDMAFAQHFGDFRERHGFRSIIRGCFHPFPSEEEKWAFFSRMHGYFLKDGQPSQVMRDLFKLVNGRNYFVVTSNIDAHFAQAGFDPARLFEIEGNCRNLQCASACHDQLYPGDERLAQMALEQRDGNVPQELVPRCPECGGPMQVHIEVDRNFLKGAAWQARRQACVDFLEGRHGKKTVFLELGVGAGNQLIKAPFMQIVSQEPHATYVTLNRGRELYIPDEIADKSIGIDGDIASVLRHLAMLSQ